MYNLFENLQEADHLGKLGVDKVKVKFSPLQALEAFRVVKG
jgi:hypothetical protein